MAFIDGIYIFVENEDFTEDVESSTHPVEEGVPITDTVKRGQKSYSLSGSIVDYPTSDQKLIRTLLGISGEGTITGRFTVKAKTIKDRLIAKKNAGTLVTYDGGDGLITSVQITSFQATRSSSFAGGYSFSMTLKECRIVKNAYVPTNNTVKDGGKQQVDKGDNKEVWYVVKKGDCVAALVAEPNAPYKNLKREGAKPDYWGACHWVLEKNPDAFSRKNDFRTLQIGKKILLGTR